MDVDLWVKDLTRSDKADGENSSEEPLSGSSSDPGSGLGLYNNGRQTFLSVPIVNIDEDPAENIKPLPVHGPSMAMLPGPLS
jgi:hypothetical protein